MENYSVNYIVKVDGERNVFTSYEEASEFVATLTLLKDHAIAILDSLGSVTIDDGSEVSYYEEERETVTIPFHSADEQPGEEKVMVLLSWIDPEGVLCFMTSSDWFRTFGALGIDAKKHWQDYKTRSASQGFTVLGWYEESLILAKSEVLA